MTKEQIAAYHKVFEEDKKRVNNKQTPKIAHQDEKIAHVDSMDKKMALVLLIAGMIGSLIFKQWYLVWVILLWWYFSNDRV